MTNTTVLPTLISLVLIAINYANFYNKSKRTFYHAMYKYYMWKNDLVAFTNEVEQPAKYLTRQTHEKCDKAPSHKIYQTIGITPWLQLLYTIGLWNLILFYVAAFYAGILYITPNERYLMNDSNKNYVPPHKQWKLVRWMKIKASKHFDKMCTNLCTWINTNCSTHRSRILLKNRNKIARRHGQAMRFPTPQSRKVIAMATLMAMSAKSVQTHQQEAYFDTDSKPIGIDNRCTACISHDINDFVGKLHDSDRTIKGFGGVRHRSNIMIGTMKWKWCDDLGQVHKHLIPHSYYVPEGKVRLLSPQHWAKTQKGKQKSTTGEFTNGYKTILQWGKDGEHKCEH